METYGQNHSLVLTGGFALRHQQEQAKRETNENNSNLSMLKIMPETTR